MSSKASAEKNASIGEPKTPPSAPLLAPLFLLSLALIALGLFLRWIDLGFPSKLTWDEHHFVENARNYLAGKPDWNDHPPLGKLFMSLSSYFLGDELFSHRVPPAIFGSASIVFAGLLARNVFQTTLSGLLAAAFIASDGFLIVYSRTALLDGMLTSSSLLALLLMTMRGAKPILFTGVVLGAALSIKFSALTLLGPFVAIFILRILVKTAWGRVFFAGDTLFGRALTAPKIEIFSYPLAIALALLTYFSIWSVGLSLTGQEATFSSGLKNTARLMAHHATLTEWKHSLLSHWWTWALPEKPIMIRREIVSGGMWRVLTTMGNPLLWWSVLLGLVISLFSIASHLRLKRREQAPHQATITLVPKVGTSCRVLVPMRQKVVPRANREAIAGFIRPPLQLGLVKPGTDFRHEVLGSPWLGNSWLVLAAIAYLSPWVVTNRDSYIYHYLPVYAILLVSWAGILSTFVKGSKEISKTGVLAYLCLVAVVSSFYAPVWAQLPISEQALKWRLFIQ